MAAFVSLLIALGIALYICWLILKPFFNVLLWAAVLAVVFYPMHRRIRANLRSPALAAAASTLLVIVFILLPVTLITIAIVREISSAAANFQQSTTSFTLPVSMYCLRSRGRVSFQNSRQNGHW